MKKFKLKGVSRTLTKDEMKKVSGGLTYWCCRYPDGSVLSFNGYPGPFTCPGNASGGAYPCDLI
jgi:bacteriocin-like protein